MPYYAVREGRNPGVYGSWSECSEQVYQYSNARYKKFYTEDEAWDFVNDEESDSFVNDEDSDSTADEEFDDTAADYSTSRGYKRGYDELEEGYYTKPAKYSKTRSSKPAVVYTDGCCSNNGQSGPRAGIGVYWGQGNPLNVSKPLPGRQTNQRAEIQAACTAVAQARSQNINKLEVRTDSKFTINGITKWVKTWENNNWTLSTGGPVKNKADFQKLSRLSHGMDINWKYVPGHAGYSGNEAADKLARKGATGM